MILASCYHGVEYHYTDQGEQVVAVCFFHAGSYDQANPDRQSCNCSNLYTRLRPSRKQEVLTGFRCWNTLRTILFCPL